MGMPTAATTAFAVRMLVIVIMVMPTATTAFHLHDFDQVVGGQVLQGGQNRIGFGVEDTDAALAQAIELTASHAAGTDDGIDLGRGCLACAGGHLDPMILLAFQINDQQRRCSAKIGGDLRIKTIDSIDRETNFHVIHPQNGNK